MAITRTPIVDDDGSMTVGTVFENAWKQEFYDQIDAAIAGVKTVDTVVLVSTTGTIHNLTVALAGHTAIVLMGNAATMITGLAGGVDGQRVTFFAGSTAVYSFAYNDAGSLQANRFLNLASSAPTPIYARGWITYEYFAALGYWYCVAHDQGAWIQAPYSAAYFSYGAGGSSWVVDPADITTLAYHLAGKTIDVSFYIVTTSVGGAPSSLEILSGAYGGFLAARSAMFPYTAQNAGAGNQAAWCQVAATGNRIALYLMSGAFTASTNSTNAYGTVRFEVT
jgi:hypothetical protein